MTQPAPANQLYFGDNLNILRDYVADESVDLIYLDPPFNSNATYNVLFREREGDESAAQIAAFEDTWHWSLDSELAYQEVVTQRRGEGRRPAGRHALIPGPERHDGLPDHDDPADDRVAPGAETHRQHLPPLRPHRQPLPQSC